MFRTPKEAVLSSRRRPICGGPGQANIGQALATPQKSNIIKQGNING
ncbi:hypothetical protein [Leptolyngbya iicbica]|uniref:Uncharacterized protein n=1 Tax=Lyngbya confervoides BDU141951 TaxID=1574623 RepID=A0A8T6QSA5_9CYAN|nr:hypothetical protein [Leptolyngbya sp. LK]